VKRAVEQRWWENTTEEVVSYSWRDLCCKCGRLQTICVFEWVGVSEIVLRIRRQH